MTSAHITVVTPGRGGLYETTLNGFRTDFARALESDRAEVRRQAEQRFHPDATAAAFHRVLQQVTT